LHKSNTKGRRLSGTIAMIRFQRLHRVTIVLAAAMYACGGNPTTSTPVPGVCRNYASSVMSTTTTTRTGQVSFVSTSTQNVTSSYNTATNQLSATGTAASSLGCQYSSSWSTNYDSVADFIDEVSVVPPKTRWVTQSAGVTRSGPSGPCANGTFTRTTTNSYDGQGRLVSRVSTGLDATFPGIEGISEGTTVYTAWDVLGRPTAYPLSPPRSVISYADAARTRSTTLNSGGLTIATVDTFDANGNPVRSQTVTRVAPPPISGGTESVETADTGFVIGATVRVCR
jgi:hypothetical protein